MVHPCSCRGSLFKNSIPFAIITLVDPATQIKVHCFRIILFTMWGSNFCSSFIFLHRRVHVLKPTVPAGWNTLTQLYNVKLIHEKLHNILPVSKNFSFYSSKIQTIFPWTNTKFTTHPTNGYPFRYLSWINMPDCSRNKSSNVIHTHCFSRQTRHPERTMV